MIPTRFRIVPGGFLVVVWAASWATTPTPGHAQLSRAEPAYGSSVLDAPVRGDWSPLPTPAWQASEGIASSGLVGGVAPMNRDDHHGKAISPWDGPRADQASSSSRRWGAVIGGLVGSATVYAVLNSGVGSTQRCNQSANQDAIETRYCVGLYLLGGIAGVGVGWLVSRWFDDDG
ncbi:MAG: hypothetical protein OEO23_02990 [Gemmatimonadota bacterium]|nr:hypothetical protein [Gemmatimonadota bacterium]